MPRHKHNEIAKPSDQVEAEHFFRSPKYLTVSSQLHLEALAQAVDKVWTLSPTFRAEKSDTPRHLSEFYMLEAELCFTEQLEDVMSLVERMLMAVAQDLDESRIGAELVKARESSSSHHIDGEGTVTAATIRRRWAGMRTGAWPRITYTEAIAHLQKAATEGSAQFQFPPSYEDGLQAEHERYIGATIGEGWRPVFITDYPTVQKPFYMASSNTSSASRGTDDTVACFDLIVPDLCELVGGSLREHRSENLLRTMQAKGVAGSNLEWYQDLRKYGSVRHGGFGLGFDRLLCYLSGVGNVRDVVAFPRWYGRCDC